MKITLNELRQLVKSIISEQSVKTYSSPLELILWTSSIQTPNYLYNATGKEFNGVYKVTKESFMPNGTIAIETTNPSVKFMFICSNKTLYRQGTQIQVFNKGYISGASGLIERYCNNINKIFPSNKATQGAKGTPQSASTKSAKDALYSELTKETPRFYDNEGEKSNTQTDRVLRIRTFMTDKDKSRVIIMTDNKGDYEFYCANNYIKSIALSGSLGQAASKFYNKAYIDKLKKYFCVKSAGGSDVLDVGTYSQTDQNAPVNVAESKLKSFIKSIINENDCGCSK